MKKIKFTKSSLFLATLFAATLVPVGTFAEEGTSDFSIAGTEDKATTKADFEITKGTLSVNGFQDMNFGKLSVEDAWNKGYSNGLETNLTVDNYLGNVTNEWDISVVTSGWTSTNPAIGTEGLNKLLQLSVGDQPISTVETHVFEKVDQLHGAEQALEKKLLKLNIEPGKDVKSGNYTNTLTWSIDSTIDARIR